VVAAGIVAGALLLRGGPPARGRGPLGGHGAVVILLAAGWFVAGLLLNSRYREQVGWDRNLGPVEQRLTDVVRYALAVLPVAVALLVLLLHRFGSSGSSHGGDRLPTIRRTPAPVPTPSFKVSKDHSGSGLGSTARHILLGIGIALLVAAVVVAAVFLWRLLYRPVAAGHPATYATADDEQRRLADAVDSGRRALLDGIDARAAVIACYLAMEESLAASGVARRVSDSPQDLLERAATSGLTGDSAAVLTELFREARYSTHPMGDSHRDRAAAALAEIAGRLDARRAAAAEAAS
jgi:hypothetical protein